MRRLLAACPADRSSRRCAPPRRPDPDPTSPGVHGARHPEHRRRLRPDPRRGRPAAEPGVPARRWWPRRPQKGVDQLLTQVASPTRLAITPGNVFPGWNVGNPLRAGWEQTRGRMRAGRVHQQVRRPPARHRLPAGARRARPVHRADPARRRSPGVVLTEGSVQGSEGMYEWLAQDLAERGYVVLTYDVQGQGTSETLPHEDAPARRERAAVLRPVRRAAGRRVRPAARACRRSSCRTSSSAPRTRSTSSPRPPTTPYAEPAGRRRRGDGVQPLLAAVRPLARPAHGDARADHPDRDHRPLDGRGRGLEGAGHRPPGGGRGRARQAAGPGSDGPLDGDGNVPIVPALAIQSEYGFTVSPWCLSGGSSLTPEPSPDGPDPMRERATGYDAWRGAGVDSMLVVPRASTHLEYTDIPLVLPASRYGQALSSVYVAGAGWTATSSTATTSAPCWARGSATSSRPATATLGAGHPAPRPAAELLLLLGVRRHARERRTRTATSPASAAEP